MRLAGKNAIVTGGAAGIGKAIALALAGEGANVAVADIQMEKANAVARQICDQGHKGLAIQCDVGDSQQVDHMVQQAVTELGGLDVLVNNAAIISQGPFWEVSDEVWN